MPVIYGRTDPTNPDSPTVSVKVGADGTLLSSGGGGGGGGGAVTVADGADVVQGAKADAAVTDPTASGTVVAFLKGFISVLKSLLPAALTGGGNLKVSLQESNATQTVTGTVGVSGNVEVVNDVGNPLPVSGTVAVSNFPGSQAVSGTVAVSNFPGTQPVSAASLPLPTGAALETGGNLATIAGKDFATQTTLAALNAKITAANTGAVVLATGTATIGGIIGGQPSATAQSITAVANLANVAVTGYPTALVGISGTHAGVNFTFQGSPDGGTTWQAIQGGQTDSNSVVSATGVITTNATRAWWVDCAGMTHVRLSVTAYTSGTGAITITPVYAPFRSTGTINVASTSQVNVVSGQPTATAQSITATGALASVATTGYPLALVTLSGTHNGTAWTFQGSPDGGTTWFSIPASPTGSATINTITGVNSANASLAWWVDCAGMSHIRLNVTGYTSGTGAINITPVNASLRSIAVGGYTQIAGDQSSGTADGGNPVRIGGLAKTVQPVAVSNGQRQVALFDKLGKQIAVDALRELKVVEQTTITSSTAETTIAAAVASTFKDLYGLVITNTSATGTKVTIKDSTAGTTRAVIWVPANETRGFTLTAGDAIPQATVNTAWTATAGTSVASLEITALTIQNI